MVGQLPKTFSWPVCFYLWGVDEPSFQQIAVSLRHQEEGGHLRGDSPHSGSNLFWYPGNPLESLDAAKSPELLCASPRQYNLLVNTHQRKLHSGEQIRPEWFHEWFHHVCQKEFSHVMLWQHVMCSGFTCFTWFTMLASGSMRNFVTHHVLRLAMVYPQTHGRAPSQGWRSRVRGYPWRAIVLLLGLGLWVVIYHQIKGWL